MSPISGGLDVHLTTAQVLALRKAIALASLCCEDHPEDCRLTPPDRVWLSEVERLLWPAWTKRP